MPKEVSVRVPLVELVWVGLVGVRIGSEAIKAIEGKVGGRTNDEGGVINMDDLAWGVR
jgi:hypothetical protein